VEDRFADLVTGHECLDEVITIARSSGRHPGKWLQETQRVGHLLREKHFDLAIDMQGRQKSALMAYLSGAPRRVGFRNEFRGVLGLQMINEVVPFEEGVTAVERSLLMAAHLFAAPEPVEFRYPLLPEAQGWAEGFLEAHGLDRTRLIALVLGASHPNKCWPAQHFARLIGSLRAEGLGEPLLLGGKVEAEREAEVQAYLEKPAASAVGRTSLPQLAALLARSRAVVAGDTGALHMAVALDRPVVGLYGPTSPRLTGPYGMGARVLWNEPPCGPCVRNPTCSDFHCMREILPERVRTVLRELLRSHA